MKLFNSLTNQIEEVTPINDKELKLYSCGPTVYDHIHIGNLVSFIYADTLARVLRTSKFKVTQIMNITDIDDKTIKRSQEEFPEEDPMSALHKLTIKYSELFKQDIEDVGNEVDKVKFINATESIDLMQSLIGKLIDSGAAYEADDGIYFSIEKYSKSGKKYGQLVKLSDASTSEARILNDEYDKENIHDFALWKTQRGNEPAWDFKLNDTNYKGRPGWHIECSAMSTNELGQPFDIHTGGIDLKFPHHENEIAQSTSGKNDDRLANIFFHNEHLLIDGRKMSKSLNNFFTLTDITSHSYDPLAFRLLVLQGHYRNQVNFTWESLEASQNRLKSLQELADLRWQPKELGVFKIDEEILSKIKNEAQSDLNIPQLLVIASQVQDEALNKLFNHDTISTLNHYLQLLDDILGLGLLTSSDITDKQKTLVQNRESFRSDNKYKEADNIRAELENQKIGLRDTAAGTIWYRL